VFSFAFVRVHTRFNRSGLDVRGRCGHREAGDAAGGPGGLEIETAGDAIDVERFAGEVEAGDEAAFHGLEVDFGKTDAAAGDEFVFVGALAGDREFGGGELGGERGEFIVGDAGPDGVGCEAGGDGEAFPEALRNRGERARRGDLAARIRGAGGGEIGAGGVGGFSREPVYQKRETVVARVELTGRSRPSE
jgi:hypothetical protein